MKNIFNKIANLGLREKTFTNTSTAPDHDNRTATIRLRKILCYTNCTIEFNSSVNGSGGSQACGLFVPRKFVNWEQLEKDAKDFCGLK